MRRPGAYQSHRAIYIKQLHSIGTHTWLDDIELAKRMEAEFRFYDDQDMHPPYVHLRAFVFGSDQGPDQKACAKEVHHDTDDLLFTFVIHSWCVLHVLALIVTISHRFKYDFLISLILGGRFGSLNYIIIQNNVTVT